MRSNFTKEKRRYLCNVYKIARAVIPYWKILQFYIPSYLCSFHFWYFSFYICAQSALAGLQRMEAAQDGLESGYDMQVYLSAYDMQIAGIFVWLWYVSMLVLMLIMSTTMILLWRPKLFRTMFENSISKGPWRNCQCWPRQSGAAGARGQRNRGKEIFFLFSSFYFQAFQAKQRKKFFFTFKLVEWNRGKKIVFFFIFVLLLSLSDPGLI